MDQQTPKETTEPNEESILKKAASNALKSWIEWAEKRILVCLSIFLLWLNYTKDSQHREDFNMIVRYLISESNKKEDAIDTKKEIIKQLSDEK